MLSGILLANSALYERHERSNPENEKTSEEVLKQAESKREQALEQFATKIEHVGLEFAKTFAELGEGNNSGAKQPSKN